MKIIALILATSLCLIACHQETDELSLASSPIDTRTQSRPFHATLNSTPDTNPDIPPTVCSGDLPGFAVGDFFIDGNATHLGNLIGEEGRIHHVSCDLSFATLSLTTEVMGQLAAANGDLVYYSGNDIIDVTNLLTGAGTTGTITGTWTVTGGTGKYAGASGSFTISGTVDFVTLTLNYEADGTIVY